MRTWRRAHSPDSPVDGERRIVPANLAVGGGEHRSQGGQFVVLRLRAHAPVLDRAQDVENQRAPGSRQSLQEVPAGVGRADRLGDAAVNRASVETLLEAEHAGTGDLLTGDDRPLDRGGSAPGREQGEVEVQPSVLRNIQQVGRDQTPVGNHDGDVGIESSYPVRHLISSLALERGRSAHVETGLTSRGGHRRGMQ